MKYTATSDIAGKNDEYYESLIHTLCHEHTKHNVDRHVLAFEKWRRMFDDGLFIKDLNHVIVLLDVLRERLDSHPDMFEPVLVSVLELCSKALLESKANERLRSTGIERIKAFYAKLVEFISIGNLSTRHICVKTFRCIANGGIDPAMLKEDIPQTSPKETACQVTDTIYIQNLIRESGAVEVIAAGLHGAFTDYASKMEELREITSQLAAAMSTRRRKQRPDSDEDKPDDDSSANSINDSGDMATLELLRTSASDTLDYGKLLLDLCLDLSVDAASASIMCHHGYLCNAMIISLREESMTARPDHFHISRSIELLWNCLECYVTTMTASGAQNLDSANIIDFKPAIITLRSVLRKLIFNGYRQSDKEVRNEIVIILTLFVNFPASVPHFINSGLLNDVVTFATVGDAGRKGWSFYSQPIPKLRNFSTLTGIDMQLKRELWLLIGDLLMSNDPDIITCIASSPFMSVLFLYLEQNSLDDGSAEDALDSTLLSTAPSEDLDSASVVSLDEEKGKGAGDIVDALPLMQLQEIQVLAMSILAGNAHRMMGEFIRVQGPARALAVLCKYSHSQTSDHRSLVYHTFLLLNRCLMTSNVVNQRLENLEAIRIFLHFFETSDDNSARAQSARMIGVMCKSTECQRQLREVKGIGPLVQALRQFTDRRPPNVGKQANVKMVTFGDEGEAPSTNEDSGGEMNVFAISVLSCIWKAIVGNQTNEALFAQKEGVDALFDMLEVSSFILRSMVLRVLSDLFDNRRLVSFAYAWRSYKTMRSIGQLLAHCWMDEEVRIGSIRGADGVLCNIWNGLGNHSWPMIPEEGVLLDTKEMGSPTEHKSSAVTKLNTAIIAARQSSSSRIQQQVRMKALDSDLRGVIAAILQSLGFLEIPVVDSLVQPLEDTYLEDEVVLDNDVKQKKEVRSFLRSLSSMGADTQPIVISPEDMSDQNLSPTDRQVISIAMRYDTLREGEWWQVITQELEEEGVSIVDADANLVEDLRERVFAASRAIQFEQMELSVVRKKEKQSEEDIFFNHIIQQKQQQIKSEYLKRKSGRKGSQTL